MSEILFTRRQWQAIADVEYMSRTRWLLFLETAKPLHGKSFSQGSFAITRRLGSGQGGNFCGPLPCTFAVVELCSELRFGFGTSKEAALAEARENLDSIGPHLDALIAEYAERVADSAAKEQTQAVIAKAKQLPRKVGKRARAVFESSEGKCHYCKTELVLDGKWHIEHKMPRALFGGSEQANLAAACVPCNMAKRDKTDLEFQAWLESKSLIASNGAQSA